MISRLRGTLVSRDGERVEVATAGGVVYEVEVPLTVVERLPGVGEEVELRTVFVVKDDGQELYGLLDPMERTLFQRLIEASGLGAKMAVKMLSAYPAARLQSLIMDRNVAALTQVSGIGKKKAERFVLELPDRVEDLDFGAVPGAHGPEGASEGVQAAVQGLIALGLGFDEAEKAVRAVLADGDPGGGPDEIIRRALADR